MILMTWADATLSPVAPGFGVAQKFLGRTSQQEKRRKCVKDFQNDIHYLPSAAVRQNIGSQKWLGHHTSLRLSYCKKVIKTRHEVDARARPFSKAHITASWNVEQYTYNLYWNIYIYLSISRLNWIGIRTYLTTLHWMNIQIYIYIYINHYIHLMSAFVDPYKIDYA